MEPVSNKQVPGGDPAFTCHVKRVTSRCINNAQGRFDMQQLVIFSDEYLRNLLKRPLAGLDVARPYPIPDLYLIDTLEAVLRRYQRVAVKAG